jgi:single-strand DNA-binding protein
MNDINQVTAIGRLIRDPEVRFASSGSAVASFSVAANHRYQDKGGQWKDEVAFIPCVSFGRAAEQLTNRKKGEPVLAIGRLRTETWLKDGVNHSRLVMVAESINFLAAEVKSKGGNATAELTPASDVVEKPLPF